MVHSYCDTSTKLIALQSVLWVVSLWPPGVLLPNFNCACESFREVHDDLVANFWHWNHFILNLLVRSFNHRLNITLKYNEIMWPWTIFNTIQSQTKVVINKSWVYSICVEKSSLFTLIRPSLNINWISNLFCFWCQDWKVTCISYFNLVHVCVIMCIIDYFI